jgi:hypothetical protein
MISNAAFLARVFAKLPPGASPWVTSFAEDPHLAGPGRWCGQAATGRVRINPHCNNFFVISSFRAGNDGVVHRRKENFAATHVVMVDDVGSKVPEHRLELDPSYLFETSPGNFQAGYLLDPPETDRAKVERLLDEMVRAGISMDGADPGMRGVTRYGRLPVGWNSKAKYVERMGAPFLHQVTVWEPGLTYSVDAIASAFGLDLSARVIPFRHWRTEVPPWAVGVLPRLEKAGIYLGPGKPGWHHVICPWKHKHTDPNAVGGTAYAEPAEENNWAGGFKCHHGHCEDRGIDMFLRFLDILERNLACREAEHG